MPHDLFSEGLTQAKQSGGNWRKMRKKKKKKKKMAALI